MLNEIITSIVESPLLWVFLTFLTYVLGGYLYRRTGFLLFTPLLFSSAMIIIILLVFDIPLETYNSGGNIISFFLTPATVSLAILVEDNFEALKEFYQSILLGNFIGVVVHIALLYVLVWLLGLDGTMMATILPKSTTTPIAIGISETIGGIVPITVAFVVITGIIGSALGIKVLNWFNIEDPIGQGVALGAATLAMGTAEAISLGDVQGAMASLSMVIAGVLTVLIAPFTMALTNLIF